MSKLIKKSSDCFKLKRVRYFFLYKEIESVKRGTVIKSKVPVITRCIVETDTGERSLGMTIFTPNPTKINPKKGIWVDEIFTKEDGKTRAFNRAIRALKNRGSDDTAGKAHYGGKNMLVQREEARQVIDSLSDESKALVHPDTLYVKCMLNPPLSDAEKAEMDHVPEEV